MSNKICENCGEPISGCSTPYIQSRTGFHHDHYCWREVIPRLRAEFAAANEREAALRRALERVVGDHHAPSDCYSTGPLTGTPMDEMCPSCDAIRILALTPGEALERVRREAKAEALESCGCTCELGEGIKAAAHHEEHCAVSRAAELRKEGE